MPSIDQKLRVLADVARALREKSVTWAVGASALLYLKGKTDSFHDIDIMVAEDHVSRVLEALTPLGEMAPPNPHQQYRTRHFLEFSIQGVEVDVMAGLVIVQDGTAYECPFAKEQIAERVFINGESIPLQSLSDWRSYYALMGRTAKVDMIDR